MAKFAKGDIFVVPFPFSDLTQAKRRPALILAELTGDDFILSQITSQNIKDRYSIPLETKTSNLAALIKRVIYVQIVFLLLIKKSFFTRQGILNEKKLKKQYPG